MKRNSTLFLIFLIFIGLNKLQAQTSALNFDGEDDYVQTTYEGIAGSADRTVEAWIRTTGNFVPTADGLQGVIVDYGTFLTGQRFTFNVLWGNAIRLEVGGNGVSGSIAVNDDEWHHVAAVYTEDGNNVALYVDGVLDTENSLTVTTNSGTGNNLMIGRRVDGVNYFDGDIDEVRFYDYARTQEEIEAEMNNEYCSLPEGLVGYWKLNEGVPDGINSMNTVAKDHSGNLNNGTLFGFDLSGTSSNWILGNIESSANSNSAITVSECESYISPSGNYTWTESGIYLDTITNNVGCDSIITLDLTIGSTFSNIIETACDFFITPIGNVYTTSGIYVDSLVSSQGCDSLVTIDLTINYSAATEETVFSCDSAFVNGNWYFDSQQVFYAIMTSEGCDSSITANVQITSVDAGVTALDATITASQIDADSYTWIDCATQMPIEGETSNTFTATQDGDYAVIVELDGCSATSECVSLMNVSTVNIEFSNDLQIIPNPNNGQFLVQLENVGEASKYEIYDVLGSVISSEVVQTNDRILVDKNLSRGVYFIVVDTSEGRLMQRVVVD